jgi:hypothetical protein
MMSALRLSSQKKYDNDVDDVSEPAILNEWREQRGELAEQDHRRSLEDDKHVSHGFRDNIEIGHRRIC